MYPGIGLGLGLAFHEQEAQNVKRAKMNRTLGVLISQPHLLRQAQCENSAAAASDEEASVTDSESRCGVALNSGSARDGGHLEISASSSTSGSDGQPYTPTTIPDRLAQTYHYETHKMIGVDKVATATEEELKESSKTCRSTVMC
jgi:hypothetical protein